MDIKSATTDVGVYTVPYLQPGTYTVTASKDGFKTEAKTDIQLNIDQTSTIDFHLSVGAASEVITVNANASQIELSKSDRGEIFDSERVNELPLDGRNPYELFTLSPGVHDFSNPAFPRPFDNVTNNFYANGAPQQPSLSLGGISNDTGQSSQAGNGTNPGLIPSVDAVQEFKVVLGAADASYGRGGGSSIDVALKSGTNQFHGILDYYKRGSWLDTYAWDNKWNAVSQDLAPTKNQHNRNQFSPGVRWAGEDSAPCSMARTSCSTLSATRRCWKYCPATVTTSILFRILPGRMATSVPLSTGTPRRKACSR